MAWESLSLIVIVHAHTKKRQWQGDGKGIHNATSSNHSETYVSRNG
jgi:hypothetical protein